MGYLWIALGYPTKNWHAQEWGPHEDEIAGSKEWR